MKRGALGPAAMRKREERGVRSRRWQQESWRRSYRDVTQEAWDQALEHWEG